MDSPIHKNLLFFIFLGLFFYFLIYLVNGENSIIKISDNLDSEILYRLLPKESGTLFSISNDAIVPQIMNGLKRNCLNVSAFKFSTLLFYFFPPFYAYLIDFIIVKSIAFIGMYLLLLKYIFSKNENKKIIASLLAISFTLLYAYTIYGIAILGLPLLIFYILNILNGKKGFFNYFFIVFYPFYSSLVLGGYAVVALIFFASVYFFLKKKKSFGIRLLAISAIMGILYLIAEINLVNQFLFDKDFVSHRTAWSPSFDQQMWNFNGVSFMTALNRTVNYFLYGYFDAPIGGFIIFGFFIFLLFINPKKLLRDRYITGMLTFLILISFLYGFYYWSTDFLVRIRGEVTFLKIFRFDRFTFLHTVAWYVLAAFLIKFSLNLKKKWITVITFLFLILNFLYTVNNNKELKGNILTFFNIGNPTSPSYKEFYAEDLFEEIKSDINKPPSSFRTVSIGLYPAISQYNGFYTLDSYQNNYSLFYKLKFRKIIEKEIDKSRDIRILFDDWGSQCYVFSAELGFLGFYITKDHAIHNLELNTDALYHLGGRYIFSAVEIKNYKDNNLKFSKLYTRKDVPIKIYLYEVLQSLAEK